MDSSLVNPILMSRHQALVYINSMMKKEKRREKSLHLILYHSIRYNNLFRFQTQSFFKTKRFCRLYSNSLLSSRISRCPIVNVVPQWRGLSETLRRSCCTLVSNLLLHYSSCNITSNPRGHILVDLDHDEEDEAVDENHAEDHTKVHPFWSFCVNLEDVFQDELTRYFR